MDIKDIIKWLFQIKAPNIIKRTAPSESKTMSKMCVILVMAAMLYSCLAICEANNNVILNVLPLKGANFKDNKLSEGQNNALFIENATVLNSSEIKQDDLTNVKSFKLRTENVHRSNDVETKEIRLNVTMADDKNLTETPILTIMTTDAVHPQLVNGLNTSVSVQKLSIGNGVTKQLIFETINQHKPSLVTSSIFGLIDGGVAYLDDLLDNKMETGTARTFGRPLRKLQSALLPIMFKLGIIATLIFMTFLLSLKAVAIGLLLLIFKVGGIIATLKAGWKAHHGHEGFSHGFGHDEWSPQKEVHLHIHNTGHHGHEGAYNYPTSGFDPWSRQDVVSAPAIPAMSAHPAPYPSVASYPASYPAQVVGPGSINTPYGHYVRTGGPTAAGYS